MLDNFKLSEMQKAVRIVNSKCLFEASGNVKLENVKIVAEKVVDYISVGAITHGVKALDISLEIDIKL